MHLTPAELPLITQEEAEHQARVAAVIAAVREAEASDPNIGRQWDSRYGRQRIRNRVASGGTIDLSDPRYEVETLGTTQIRRYPARSIEQTILRDEHELTPEYAAEIAALAENAARAERESRKREAALAREHAAIALFTAGKTPMAAGKAREALMKEFRFDGEVMTLKHKVEQLVADGKSQRIEMEWAIQEMTRKQFNRASGNEQAAHEKRRQEKGKIPFYYVGNYRLGKTAHDYAAHLISQQAPA